MDKKSQLNRVKDFSIKKTDSVKNAMVRMKEIGEKVLFVVDDHERLFGAVSGGDIRKWILSEGNINEAVELVCNQTPVYVRVDYDIESIKKTLLDLKIECIPVVDDQGRMQNILIWDIVFRNGLAKPRNDISVPVVIMAGGKGNRLDPFTRILPKPLIPIGEKAIIEIIMDKFKNYNVSTFYLSVNHKAQMIKSYFNDINCEYNIGYIEEPKPLGTAGSLKLIPDSHSDTFLVTNCDIIIEGDLSEIVKLHNEKQYDMTMVVSYRNYVIPYGVCNITNGGLLESISEKPAYDLLVNTGMYVINRAVLDLIPDDTFYDVTDLLADAKNAGLSVGVFPIDESSWIDVGQWDEYRKTIKKFMAVM